MQTVQMLHIQTSTHVTNDLGFRSELLGAQTSVLLYLQTSTLLTSSRSFGLQMLQEQTSASVTSVRMMRVHRKDRTQQLRRRIHPSSTDFAIRPTFCRRNFMSHTSASVTSRSSIGTIPPNGFGRAAPPPPSTSQSRTLDP